MNHKLSIPIEFKIQCCIETVDMKYLIKIVISTLLGQL